MVDETQSPIQIPLFRHESSLPQEVDRYPEKTKLSVY